MDYEYFLLDCVYKLPSMQCSYKIGNRKYLDKNFTPGNFENESL